jgi:starch synthase
MLVLHVSAECYPAAKSGGLGDVAGALPKYLKQAGWDSTVVIPKYSLPWIKQRRFRLVHVGAYYLNQLYYPYTIEETIDGNLDFPLFMVNLPALFDRPGIYGDTEKGWYTDNTERFSSFQLAILDWVKNMELKPELIHCHDYHAGLIPFLVKYTYLFELLKKIPTVFTIHNAEYAGAFPWEKKYLLPEFPDEVKGLLDWSNLINPLAAAVKNAWAITTVSPGYLLELQQFSSGLEWLFKNEKDKSVGILNGIDHDVWNPKTDKYLSSHLADKEELQLGDIKIFKQKQKKDLFGKVGINQNIPWITFIGRLVREKGADLLPQLIKDTLEKGTGVGFILLGSGERYLQEILQGMSYQFPGKLFVHIGYDETLAHRLYAASDFILMPSRVEPCGLNQLYALRYGTIPIVRAIGGLKDAIVPWRQKGGNGILFESFTVEAAAAAINDACLLFQDRSNFESLRKYILGLDFSWQNSASKYINLYQRLTKNSIYD